MSMPGNKHQALSQAIRQGELSTDDIVKNFGWDNATARSYLSKLGRQGLLDWGPYGWKPTEKGKNRLTFFDRLRCPREDCPLCKGREAGYKCRHCGHVLSEEDAGFTPRKKGGIPSLFRFSREGGVFCPRCRGRILTQSEYEYVQKRLKNKGRDEDEGDGNASVLPPKDAVFFERDQ